jgi:hypothetical protein
MKLASAAIKNHLESDKTLAPRNLLKVASLKLNSSIIVPVRILPFIGSYTRKSKPHMLLADLIEAINKSRSDILASSIRTAIDNA